jgi:hypothetical protein
MGRTCSTRDKLYKKLVGKTWMEDKLVDLSIDGGKFFLCFNWAPRYEGVLGSGVIAPRILDLGTTLRWVVSFTPSAALSPGKETLVPIG